MSESQETTAKLLQKYEANQRYFRNGACDRTILITGAAGFIGANVLIRWLQCTDWKFVLLDSFRHKGSSSRLHYVLNQGPSFRERCTVINADLSSPLDSHTLSVISEKCPQTIVNMASDSSVAHSIVNSYSTWRNNCMLMHTMLELQLHLNKHSLCDFIQVGTDEVFGECPADLHAGHDESAQYHPNNTYAASKAAQEMLCMAYWRTHSLPITLTNTMNNFGPMQDSEKFIPRVIGQLLRGEEIQVYVDEDGVPGSRVYLHTTDHADALACIIHDRYRVTRMHEYSWHWSGRWERSQHSYTNAIEDAPRFNVAGSEEHDNLQVVEEIARIMGISPKIRMVKPAEVRPGYDKRYSLNGNKMRETYNWEPSFSFFDRLRSVVAWTVENQNFLAQLKTYS